MVSNSDRRGLSGPEGGGVSGVLVVIGPRGGHLSRWRRHDPGGLGPMRVTPVLKPVPHLDPAVAISKFHISERNPKSKSPIKEGKKGWWPVGWGGGEGGGDST